MIREILKMGDERLLRIAPPVPPEMFNSAELWQLIDDMFQTMESVGGVGLAAPQIGVDLQLVIFGFEHSERYPDAEAVPQTILINPLITPLNPFTEEGFDPKGEPIVRVASGFHARVVQHECDHLIGRLYPSRITDFSKFGFTEVMFPDLDPNADD